MSVLRRVDYLPLLQRDIADLIEIKTGHHPEFEAQANWVSRLKNKSVMTISTQFNRLTVEGTFELPDMRRSIAALYRMRQQGFEDSTLDMAALERPPHPSIMLPFATHCRGLWRSGFKVRLELPRDRGFARLFQNSNWASLIDETSYEASTADIGNHVPAITFGNPTQHYEAVTRVVEFMMGHVSIKDRRELQAMEWALNEITDNVLNHAESQMGGVVQANYIATRNEVEFIVCDCGLGIPKTLRSGQASMRTDTDPTCLDQAIREGVTKNARTNQGNGLYGAYRLAQLSEGRFDIHSGFATLTYRQRSGLSISKQEVPYPGTAVVCAMRLDDPDLLAEALTFKGQRYVPSYTIVDKLEEAEVVTIDLATECRSFGSRIGAMPIRQKIENILLNTSARIVLKLDDVALITSSFADEVFGKTFILLGPVGFGSRIKIVGANKIVTQLIDRAIMQRMNNPQEVH